MATVHYDASSHAAFTAAMPRRLHRIQTLRLEQDLSLQTCARRMGADVRQLRLQEQECTDLRVSDLHRWKDVLGASLSELLVEPESSLTRPTLGPGRLERLREMATTIQRRARSASTRRMAEMLLEQLEQVAAHTRGADEDPLEQRWRREPEEAA